MKFYRIARVGNEFIYFVLPGSTPSVPFPVIMGSDIVRMKNGFFASGVSPNASCNLNLFSNSLNISGSIPSSFSPSVPYENSNSELFIFVIWVY